MVEDGDVRAVLRELAGLTPAERGRGRTALQERRSSMGATDWRARPVDEWQDERIAQLAAELGCVKDARAAGAWLRRDTNAMPLAVLGWEHEWLPEVLNLRPVAWRAELIGPLASALERGSGAFPLIERLVRDTGATPPTSTAFLNRWLNDRNRAYARPDHAELLVGRLRDDPMTPHLLPAALRDSGVHWSPGMLETLGAAGMIDRLAILDVYVGKLFAAPDRTVRWHWLGILQAFAPTTAERLARVPDHLTMLDGDSKVAAFALESLTALDAADPELLTEVSERALRRPEKKLVRAHLSTLDAVARRDPGRAGQVVLAAAVAFQHPDAAMQELALTTAGRHLEAAGPSVLPELRAAAETLDPAVAVRAGELLGMPGEVATAPAADVLPVPGPPVPVPDAPASAAEVAAEVGAVCAGDQDVVAFERALDGLVRTAHLDRDGLAEVLRPVVRAAAKRGVPSRECTTADLREVAAAVTGDALDDALAVRRGHRAFRPPAALLADRISEAADAVRAGPPPFLLATPTLATGALDAAVLVERVAAYERLGLTPGPHDLAQALLRVSPGADDAVLAGAGGLGSEAGKQVAAWLSAGGVAHRSSAPEDWERPGRRWEKRWAAAAPRLDPPVPLPPAATDLLAEDEVFLSGCTDFSCCGAAPRPFWAAQLPHHRDELTARIYRDTGSRRKAMARWVLPLLAEGGGPAGYALHLVLARGLEFSATDQPHDRTAVVDAILIMAGRGDLDTALMGRQLAVVIRADAVLAARAAATLRVVADAGADRTVFEIVRAALPGVLGDEPVRGAGDLLALAARCALRSNAGGEIPEVTAVAGRKGSSLVVKNARTLRDALA